MGEEDKLKENWQTLLQFLKENIGKKPVDLNGVLFVIGVQELGQGKKFFTKEQKQDLMHIAICRVLSYGGYYELEGKDKEGWPHWKLIKPLPNFDLLSQEKLLKHFVIEYFRKEVGLHI
ncbi:hypothetical protein [Emticicia sp. BO119]|uniref:hypothetical protein n=1 Tax=Emticicia sp. BO119 TaxID=2757768 RepID=UPI0015F0829A|nr:hypothetical protein [Emticicia sp. BO119]MBA4851634.1 hypothetical protein [Emticicia sp. BO119]